MFVFADVNASACMTIGAGQSQKEDSQLVGQGKVISVVQVYIVMIGLGVVACMQDRRVLQNLAWRFV